MKKSLLNYADKGGKMSNDYNRLLAENKILRQENKRLRKKLDKKLSFMSQEYWQKSLDLIIRFLQVAKTTKIETILTEQREKNGNFNK